MSTRPVSLAASVALVAVIGGGVAVMGLLLVAVAAGAVGFLDPVGGIRGVVGLLGLVSILAGIAVIVAAAGLWMRRAWAWAASVVIAVASVIGAIVALDTAGPQFPIQVGLVLAGGAVALLLAPRTRSAAGIA